MTDATGRNRMSPWYEVYDNAQMQLLTRRSAAKMTVRAAAACAFTLILFFLGVAGSAPLALTLPIGAGLLLFVVWRAAGRLRSLRRLVWCVKLSAREIVGYDYARRQVTIAWSEAERIEIRDTGVAVVGSHSELVEVVHLFPDFAQLSHRIVYYADMHGVPVFVNGRPWQQLDVYDLFPFLTEKAPAA